MEKQFVETIKIKDGEPQRLAYHQERMERTIRHFFPDLYHSSSLPSLAQLLPPVDKRGILKARVVYGQQGIASIDYTPYMMREIRSLQVVEDNDIDYTYKSCDRSLLSQLVSQKGDSDEIIIVKKGLVTDTSYTNLAIHDGQRWLTPKYPLLAGTQRASLLEHGIIQEAVITLADLKAARKVSLFNAMIEFGEREVDIQHVHI